MQIVIKKTTCWVKVMSCKIDACITMIYEKYELWRVVCDIAWTLSTHSVGALV